jgi:hypothetical protein
MGRPVCTTRRIEFRIELEQFAIALVDPGDARIGIDGDGAFKIFAQQAERPDRLLDVQQAMRPLVAPVGPFRHTFPLRPRTG